MSRGSRSTGTVIVARRDLLREGVAALLSHSPYKIVASAQRPSELRDLPHSMSGSRVLVILGMDDSNGGASELSENIRSLRSLFPDSTIVVIAENHSPVNVQQIVTAGPNGYVANLSSRGVLLKLLEVVLLDQQLIVLSRPNTLTARAEESESAKGLSSENGTGDLQHLTVRKFSDTDPQLSQREREILIRLAQGESNKQIARLCKITESTVKVHLKAILRKITVHNRTQAAIWAITKGYHVRRESNGAPKQTPGAADRSSIERRQSISSAKSVAAAPAQVLDLSSATLTD